jgi:acyl-CoA thioesterase
MGGYVAAVALRAAGAASAFARPASFFCHYLGVAAFDRIDLAVVKLRAGRTAEALRVTATQGARAILDAMVWTVGPVQGLEHHEAAAPEVRGPEGLRSREEHFPDQPQPYPFWSNVECRLLEVIPTWPPEGALPPVWRTWMRFRPRATFDDPWVDAVILVDVLSWPSAHRHHAWREPSVVAPSLDLYVAFHEPAPDEPWLLGDGEAPVAGEGIIGWTGRLWSSRRRLVASGGGQLVCRPLPPARA